MGATQFSRAEGMMDRESGNPLLRAETCIKRRTSSYTVWVRIQGKGIVRNPQVKIPLEKSKPMLEDNIKMDLTEVGCKRVAWIHLP
jgi:hypothetical protein